mmetsp:Transcript_29733/g.76803  ORF Transcript_29733/g.76803 Transcript_29733/m.76803 type:complete len:322 (-) Transcript_29733:2122-3087(-)
MNVPKACRLFMPERVLWTEKGEYFALGGGFLGGGITEANRFTCLMGWRLFLGLGPTPILFSFSDSFFSQLADQLPRDFMDHQEDINFNMRSILVDWLTDVRAHFQYSNAALFLTVRIMDHFVYQKQVKRERYQLVGVTAMCIAVKYLSDVCGNDIINDLVYITDRAYSKRDILQMERHILFTIGFRLGLVTPFSFHNDFTETAGKEGAPTDEKTEQRIHCLIHYMYDLVLPHMSFLKYVPSHIAAAALYLARAMCVSDSPWNPALVEETHYQEEDLLSCVREIAALMQTPYDDCTWKAAKRVYRSLFRWGGVSELSAPHDL